MVTEGAYTLSCLCKRWPQEGHRVYNLEVETFRRLPL